MTWVRFFISITEAMNLKESLYQKVCARCSGLDLTALAIFIFALAVRLCFLAILLAHSPIDKLASSPPDTLRYMQLGNDFYHLTIKDENSLYMVGFGYGLFLAILFLITAKSLMISLILQLAVGAVSTVYLYKIGMRISGNKALSIIAASINAVSPTSLSLGTSFLSETVFFACIVALVYTFIGVLESPTRRKWILLAAVVSYATFTRSVAQFLPLVIIGVVLVIPKGSFSVVKKTVIKGCTISMLAVIALLALWALRNYYVNDLFVVAGTGPGAAAAYLGTKVATEQSDSLSFRDNIIIFNQELRDWMKVAPGSMKRYNEWCVQKLKSLIRKDPLSFVHSYLLIVWDNVRAYDEIPQYRFPIYKRAIVRYTDRARKYRLDLIPLILATAGFVIFLYKKKIPIAIFLASIYAYFGLISGFTWGQGSRIFYPAQAAGVLFIAAAIYYPCSYSWRRLHEIWRSKLYESASTVFNFIRRILFYPNRLLNAPVSAYRRFLTFLFSLIFAIILIFEVIVPGLRGPQYRIISTAGTVPVFGDQIVLSQVRLEEKDNATSAIIFDFYPTMKIEDDYRVFFHLYPKGGKMINRDFAPEPPIPYWEPFVMVSQRRDLNLPPGEYAVTMGIFYNVQRYLGEPYSFTMIIR